MEQDGDGNEKVWDGREYMHAKKRKLREQFADLDQKSTSEIFSGVTIYVNGWTQPNADELKRLVHAHGGHYEYNLYGDSGVTHTIATNLPNAKIRNLKNTIVCTPEWIVDSISSGRRLPVDNYLLYARLPRDQNKLKFKVEEPRKANDPSVAVDHMNKQSSHAFQTGPNQQLPVVTSLSNSLDSITPRAKPGLARQYDTTKGAEFVHDYYAYSRLHYLSTWSTELKQFTSKNLPHVTQKHPKLPTEVSLRGQKKRLIAHIDLDCFFVAVSLRDRPHLKGKPVAVCHAKLPKGKSQDIISPLRDDTQLNQASHHDDNKSPLLDVESDGASVVPQHLLKSMSDIASCSYEARSAGLRNGMFVGEALKLCPNLQLIPYEFDKYHEVSKVFYTILMSHSACLEPVSCDEAYIELTDYIHNVKEAEGIVQEIRDEVESATGCTVSAGVAHNMLLARMATKIAKPNGQYFLPPDEVWEFLGKQRIQDLPGVGYSTALKFHDVGVETCSQLRQLPMSRLKSDFGSKTGQMLYNYCRGKDDRQLKLVSERKSISVDLNYGIRFQTTSDAESLLQNLSKELEKRAAEAEMAGCTLTLKLMIRKPDAPTETRKYLGHGRCNNMSRSCSLLQPTADAVEMCRLANRLLKQMNPRSEDIRGVGIQLTKLVSTSSTSQQAGAGGGSSSCCDLRNMLAIVKPPSETLPLTVTQEMPSLPNLPLSSKPELPHTTTDNLDDTFIPDLPPLSQLDSSVLEALPPELADKILCCYTKQDQNSIPTNVTSEETKKSPFKQPSHTSRDDIVRRRGRGRGRGRGKGKSTGSPIRSPLKRSTAKKGEVSPNKQKLLFDILPSAVALPSAATSSFITTEATTTTACDTEISTQSTSKDYKIPTTATLSIEDNATTTASIASCDITSDNQAQFISDFRAYIREWVTNSPDGPLDSDLNKVVDYFIELCSKDLEAAFIVLKGFRRLAMKCSMNWCNAFNSLLEGVQGCIHSSYNGSFPIDKIVPPC